MLIIVCFVAVMLLTWWQFGTGIHLWVMSLFFLAAAVHEFVVKRNELGTWAVGAEAEELVGQRLGVLQKRGWHALHNLQKPDGGDIDHVTWGPRGVFVIETKGHRGKVGVESGVLTLDGVMPERDAVAQAYQNALFIKNHLTRRLGRSQWVVAVVCLTKAFLDGYQLDIPRPQVHIVKIERLIEFLENYDDTR